MFELDAIRREATETSFLRGKAYYKNNRIRDISIKATGNGLYKIHAVVRGAEYYDTIVSIDIEANRLVSWKCSCPYDYGGACKHIVAVSIKFLFDMQDKSEDKLCILDDTEVKQESNSLEWSNFDSEDDMEAWVDNNLEGMVFDNLGLTSLKNLKSFNLTNKFRIIFNEFNIDSNSQNSKNNNQLQVARGRRFSLKVLYPSSLNFAQKGIRIDRDIIRSIGGAYSLFLENIVTNGVYMNGLYYLGQLNIDVVFSLAAGLEEVMYGNPPKKIQFFGNQYKPEIEVLSKADGAVTMAFEEDMIIIPGKYSTFILKEDKIMKLHESIPWSFINKMATKPTVAPELHGKLMSKVLPILKNAFEVKKVKETSPVNEANQEKPVSIITRDIQPQVNIYVKYEKDTENIYILPEIWYDDYLGINPFSSMEIQNYENFYYMAAKMKTLQSVERDDTIIQFKRDIYKEQQVYATFNNTNYFIPDEYGRLPVEGEEILYSLFTGIIPTFPEDWKVLYDKGLEKLKFKKEDVSCKFDFSADTDNGLLEFDLEFHCGNLKIRTEQLYDYINNNRKLLNIDGSFIEITNREELYKLFSLLEGFNAKDKNKRYSGKLYQAIELDAFVENADNPSHYSYKSNENYQKLIQEAKDNKLLEKVKIPEKFEMILRSYQLDGVQWMYFLRKYGFGGILADDMGLGKTLQVLVMLSMISTQTPSLIICPKTLIHNWYNEIQKFVPNLKVLIACGGSVERITKIQKADEYGIIITSYPLIHKDIETYKKMEFEYCIIDEAQYIKNPSTRTARCVKSLRSKFRLALTGTPLENTIIDLWSVFDFVMPEFLGDESSFKARFGNASVGEPNLGAAANLNKKIKPFILRRTKKEMLKDLPPKIEQVGMSELTTGQLALYTKMLEKIRGDLYDTISKKGFKSSQIEILAGLTRLRQICNHPGLVNEKFIEMENISGKLELFEELLDECIEGGHKVLVFSQFVKMLDILSKVLDKKKIRYCRLDGQSRNREEIISTFNTDDTVKVFLISLKAGGFGLNLTSADTVILYDPWWNPMVEEQASDRAHRMGQHKAVNVYRMITKGTVEEKIQKLQERKKMLFDSIINESGDVFKKLSWEDLKDILE